jgi:hypothetical protein
VTAVESPSTTARFNGEALTTENRGGVLIITLDQPGDAVNKVDRALGSDLEQVLEQVDRDRTVYAIVVISGKPDIFIAGADIEQFLEFRTEEDAEAASRYGQRLLNFIDTVRVSVVGSSWRSHASIAFARTIPRPSLRCRKCSSASFLEWAGPSDFRVSSACGTRST